MTQGRSTAARLLAAAVLTAWGVSACGLLPEEGATDAAEAPLQHVATEGERLGPVTVALPDGFEVVELQGDGTSQQYGARLGTPGPGESVPALLVTASSETTRSVQEEAENYVRIETLSARGGRDVVSESVPWPGADEAWFVAMVRGTGDQAPLTAEFLLVRVEDQMISVVATAPADEYDSIGLHDAIASVSIDR